MTLLRPPASTSALLFLLLLLSSSSSSTSLGPRPAGAWSLSSLIYGEEEENDSSSASDNSSSSSANKHKHHHRHKAKLPKILSRDLEASVSARSWPTTPFSPLCEAWGFIDAGRGDDDDDGWGGGSDAEEGDGDNDEDSEAARYERWKWSYLDALAFPGKSALASLDSVLKGNADDSGGGEWSYSDSVDLAVLAAGHSYGSSSGSGSGSGSAGDFESSLESRLLRYDLSLRAHSPLCELHRTLARDAAIASGLYDPAKAGGGGEKKGLPAAFAVVHPAGLVSADGPEIVEAFKQSSSSSQDDGEGEEGGESPLLPGERPRPSSAASSDGNEDGDSSTSGVIVLYGQWGSSAFSKLYTSLKDADVPFVVRFMGAIDHEERMTIASSPGGGDAGGAVLGGTVLQGYGVRLDIRNIEYKVFDDKADDDSVDEEDDDDDDEEEGEEGERGAEEADESTEGEADADTNSATKKKGKTKKLRSEYLAGLNLTRLAERAASSSSEALPEDAEEGSGAEEGDGINVTLPSALSAIQSSLLLDSHHYSSHHSQTVPPTWQRRDLSLQAASAVASSLDPLRTLQDVSQNLPSYASTLVELDVPDEIRSEASKLESVPVVIKNGGGEFGMRKGNAAQGQGAEGAFAFYVNGRKISVDRPSFNLFELMGVLREEDALLGRMESELGPHFVGEGASLALGAVRDMIEMGGDALEKLGASKKSSKQGAQEEEDSMFDEMDEEEDDEGGGGSGGGSTKSGKFRIDVGRGYRGAVAYVNDVEKDRQYAQWPRSVQQMMMMAQFGGPPTVRRNLFTVLLVIDPTSGRGSGAALDVILQFVQGNYPMRVGFLIVGESELEKCKKALASGEDECTPDEVRTDEALPATAHAAMLLFKSVQSSYGGMMGLSWMNFVLGYWGEDADQLGIGPPGKKSKMSHLIDAHAAFLERAAQVSKGRGRRDAIKVLAGGGDDDDSSSDEKDAVTYAKALKFAVTKNVGPGMGFVNGVPLPSRDDGTDGPETQRVLMEEQRNVMGMIAGGKITDKGPRSIYAMLLTGSGVYPRMHPLLTEPGGAYASVSHGFGETSLLRPNGHEEIDLKALSSSSSEDDEEDVPAVFVVEAHLDLSTPKGLALARTYLDAMDSLPAEVGGEPVSASYRLVPSGESKANSGLAAVLSKAGEFGAGSVRALVEAAEKAASSGGDSGISDVAALVDSLDGASDDVKSAMKEAAASAAAAGDKIPASEAASDLPSTNCLLANGRLLDLSESSSVDSSDVEILLTLEMGRSRASTKMLGPHGAGGDAVARTAAFLGRLLSDGGKGGPRRTDAEAQLRELKDSPLHFEWNGEGDGDDDVSGEEDDGAADGGGRRRIQVKVTAILDPLSEPTQRVTPLLRAVRDQLRLPLRVVVAPRTMIGADDSLPITSYYRFVADPLALPDGNGGGPPKASFRNLPTNHVLTIRMDVPEPWNVQQSEAVQDTDNLRCDATGKGGCSDDAYAPVSLSGDSSSSENGAEAEGKAKKKDRSRIGLTKVEYDLSSLLFFGQCYDVTQGSPPNGLQLTMDQASSSGLALSPGLGATVSEVEISPDGSVSTEAAVPTTLRGYHSDTLVMKTVGYWQLRAKPGVFTLTIAKNTRGSEIYQMVKGEVMGGGRIKIDKKSGAAESKSLVMKDFTNRGQLLLVQKKKGFEDAELFSEEDESRELSRGGEEGEDDVIHVFSLATGHLYERFLKIMMLSVTKRTSARVKFWLFENYLSPSFKSSATAMAERIGCEVAFVTYKWPEWLRGQSEKQRIIWGYKILFLDTLFPLDVKKIIYVDADQVVRGDLKELWDMDLDGAPYGYTPFCDSRETTLGFQFWRSGFWETHLRGRPYHISALYVVDLRRFRRELVGDKLRQYYQQLSADPGSLANLDQDLPNYAQHDVRIFSLPQEWLWCESWCSDETKPQAKTIDLCNNPLHKEPKVSMAKRVISGELFQESWVELDEEVQKYEDEYRASLDL